ncbi:hypothetical protein DD606_26160 [Enterobacter cloacae complex sp. GF14B]|nr:hypothetical protein DD606_26160 [Enterobacter cloacae complex sp. GF14B]
MGWVQPSFMQGFRGPSYVWRQWSLGAIEFPVKFSLVASLCGAVAIVVAVCIPLVYIELYAYLLFDALWGRRCPYLQIMGEKMHVACTCNPLFSFPNNSLDTSEIMRVMRVLVSTQPCYLIASP